MNVALLSSVADAAVHRALVQSLHEIGFQTELVGGIPADIYRRPTRGLFERLLRRWRMYVGYLWTVQKFLRRTHGANDLRIVTTNPFFLPALVQVLSSRKTVNICLIYDLYPDSLKLEDGASSGGFITRVLTYITKYSLRESAATVFLGPHLQRYAESKYGSAKNAAVIAVGADANPFRDSKPQAVEMNSKRTVLYVGNLGRMHDTATLESFWKMYASPKISWLFHASGAGYNLLRKKGDPSFLKHDIEFGDPLTDDEWAATLKRCPVALVTLKPGAESLVMPSKAYSAMVAGQALIAICPRVSDLGDLVRDNNCGWVVEPGDVDALKLVLDSVSNDRESLDIKRRNSFEAGHRLYSSHAIADAWKRLLVKTIDDRAAIL